MFLPKRGGDGGLPYGAVARNRRGVRGRLVLARAEIASANAAIVFFFFFSSLVLHARPPPPPPSVRPPRPPAAAFLDRTNDISARSLDPPPTTRRPAAASLSARPVLPRWRPAARVRYLIRSRRRRRRGSSRAQVSVASGGVRSFREIFGSRVSRHAADPRGRGRATTSVAARAVVSADGPRRRDARGT